MSFTTFGLSDHILQGVRAAGYTAPTPIQSLAIRPALAGRDIIASAQTGTGKTAAFVLPLLHRLAGTLPGQRLGRYPRALVLTPTRELAQQVQDSVATYGRFLTLSAVSIYGGVSMDKQIKLLRRGADIVVATPGRLLDHLQHGTIDLSKIQVLVLDEADRMLDMGFINDVRKILGRIPKERQTLLFSATLSGDITALAGSILRNPETLETGERHNPVDTITQHFYEAPREGKMDLLAHALDAETMQSVLVFSRTKHGADKISRRLERGGIAAVAIHSNRTQAQRERALDGFKRGTYRVLVATDIAARGIDVSGISHVINFDVPRYAEDYIHRIGRTGRAGASGDALTFVSRDEHQYLRRIEQFTGKRFPLKQYPGAPARVAPISAGPVSNGGSHARTKPQRTNNQGNQGKKTHFVGIAKKKRPLKKLDAFSTSSESQSWSNY
ncbi:MAG TPA: DEAD/DEAH box helicase [Bacteroidota bacterium]|nr:DEAD/DEAH box helicase [Bacteroidota bacterium]